MNAAPAGVTFRGKIVCNKDTKVVDLVDKESIMITVG